MGYFGIKRMVHSNRMRIVLLLAAASLLGGCSDLRAFIQNYPAQASPTSTVGETVAPTATLTRTPVATPQTSKPGSTSTPLKTKTLTNTPKVTNTPQTTASPTPQTQWYYGKGIISSVIQTPDKRRYLYQKEDTLFIIDAFTFKEIGHIDEACSRSDSILVSPDSRYAAQACNIGGRIIDLVEMKNLGYFGNAGNGSVWPSEFSKDSRYLAYKNNDFSTGGRYESVGVWDVTAGKGLFVLSTGEDDSMYHTMTYPVISPDQKWIAAGYKDTNHAFLLFWDFTSGELVRKIPLPVNLWDIDFSPDGRTLAGGDDGGMIRLWNVRDGQQVRAYGGFPTSIRWINYLNGNQIKVWQWGQSPQVLSLANGSISQLPVVEPVNNPLEKKLSAEGYAISVPWGLSTLAISPDRTQIAQGLERITIWEAATGRVKLNLPGLGDQFIAALQYSPDGRRLAALGDEGGLAVWDLSAGKTLYQGTVTPGYYANGNDVIAFSPSGKILAIGDGLRIKRIDIDTGKTTQSAVIGNYDHSVTKVEFISEGSRICAALNDGRTIQILEAATAGLIEQIQLPGIDPDAQGILGLSWPLYARMGFQGNETWIELWDLETLSYLKLWTPSQAIGNLTFSADHRLLYGVVDKRLYAWDVSTGIKYSTSRYTLTNQAVAISQDGERLAYGQEGLITLFDISEFPSSENGPSATMEASPRMTSPDTRVIEGSVSGTAFQLGNEDPSSQSRLQPSIPISLEDVKGLDNAGHFSPGTVESARWGSGGKLLITASHSVASLSRQGELSLLVEKNARFTGIATRTDGHLLTCGVVQDTVFIYDLTSGSILLSLPGEGNPSLSPNGKYLVYKTLDRNYQTYDLERNQPLAILLNINTYWDADTRFSFNPDGSLVAGNQGRLTVLIWNTLTGKVHNALGGPDDLITNLAFSPDGRFLTLAGGGSAWLWETRPGGRGREFRLFDGTADYNLMIYLDTVTATAMSPDNGLLAIGTSQKEIRLVDLADGRTLRILTGHAAPPSHLLFSPDGQRLVSIDQDGVILQWNLSTGTLVAKTSAFSGPVQDLVIRDDGRVSAWGSNTAWVIDPATASIVNTEQSFFGTLLGASPDGRYLVAYQPYQAYLVDAQNGEVITALEGEAEDVFVEYHYEGRILRKLYGATFSRDSRLLATHGAGGLWLYDLSNTPRLVHRFGGTYTPFMAFSPDNRYLEFSINEFLAEHVLYDLTNGFHETPLVDDYVFTGVTFSWDGKWLAATENHWNSDNQVILWDVTSGAKSKSFPLGTEIQLTVLTFSPDDSLIAVGREDGSILLLDAETGKIVWELAGHTGSISALAFTPDGLYLVSGSTDGSVRFWAVNLP